jgi:hypothetical protein
LGWRSSRRTAALFRFPASSFHRVLMPWIVRWDIHRGLREEPRGGERQSVSDLSWPDLRVKLRPAIMVAGRGVISG